MTVFLKTAAAGLALGVLTLGVSASAHAADPEGRFRVSAEMDGSLTIHPDGSMDLDAVMASESFGSVGRPRARANLFRCAGDSES